MKTGARLAIASIALAAIFPIAALAQRFDPKRPANFTVGAPRGPAATERLDAHRTGASSSPLPNGRLKIGWHHLLGEPIAQPPLLVGSEIVLLAGRGEVVFLDAGSGTEIARVSTRVIWSGPATALSDGTIVAVDSDSGDAIGVKKTGVVFRTHLGGERAGHIAPLSLDDGGAVVASATELDVLDARGGVRARASVPEQLDGALLSAHGLILAVTDSGVVYAWSPGKDPERVGNFDGHISGATLADDQTLLAVVDGARLMSLDLQRGVAAPRDTSAGLLFVGPVAVRGDNAFMLAKAPGRAMILAIDRAGQETMHAPVIQSQIPLLADGGVAAPTVGGHAPLVVDGTGAVAFAIEDEIGVVAADGTVTRVGSTPCRSRSSDILGIAPNGALGDDAAFVVACEDGAVALVEEAAGAKR